MRLLTIPEISARLQDRRLDVVANATGLSSRTVFTFKAGNAKGANITTIEKLSAYLLKDCDCDCDFDKNNTK